MIIQNQVGPVATISSIAGGTQVVQRAGNLGDTIVSELHGRYYETNYRRALYSGSIVSQVTTVGLATTYTGLLLANPVGSTWNLVINKVGYAFAVAPAASMVIGLMTGYNASTNVTLTTPVTARSQFFGTGASGVGLLASSATMPTAPTLNLILGAMSAATITTAPTLPGALYDLEGSIILPAGAYCAFYTSVASGAASGAFSFQWEEVPV
jgi:hypothetical protein